MDQDENIGQPQGKRKLDQRTPSPHNAASRNVRPRRDSRSSAAALTPEEELIKDLKIVVNTQKSQTLHQEALTKIVNRFFPRSIKVQVDNILDCVKNDESITDGYTNYLTEELSKGIRQRSIALIAQDCSTRDRMLHNLRVLIHDAAMIQKKPYEDEIEARLIPRTPVPSQRLATQATILKNSPQTPKRQKIVDPRRNTVIDLLLGEDSESINYLYQDSVVSRIVDAVVKREKSNANTLTISTKSLVTFIAHEAYSLSLQLNTTKFFYLNGVMHDFRVNESHAMAKRLNAVYDSLPQDSTRLRRGLDESLQPLVRYNKLKFAELSDHFFVKEKLEYPVLELLRYDDPSLPQPLEMPRNTCSLKGKTTMDRLLEALRSRVSKLAAEDAPLEIPIALRLDRPNGMTALLRDFFDMVAAKITKGVPYDRRRVAQDLEFIMERAARVWANAFRELRDYPFMGLRDAKWDLNARELGAGDGM
ncbi:hypothetical protein LTR04_005160 [Oleoguttula sp. CCFEE 6159]|nr:hypothetical protein LTR04_005160 [Oleoguttula sp. CCFEE 6159]